MVKMSERFKKKKIFIHHKNSFNIPIFSMNANKATNFILKKILKDNNYLINK